MAGYLFIIPRMGAGGAEKVVAVLANDLAKQGHFVKVYSIQAIKSFFKLDEKVVYESGAHYISGNRKLFRLIQKICIFPGAFRKIRQEMKSGRYDVIFPFNYAADVIVGMNASFGLSCRYICSERNDPNRVKGVMRRLCNMAYQNADFLICQSKAVYDYYDFIPAEKKKIIPNGININAEVVDIGERTKRIVSVGRLDKQKNYAFLIESFAEFCKSDNIYTLDIYGEGLEKKRIIKLIKKLDMGERVRLKGICDNTMEAIKDASAFVISSDYEGFPNVILEAMCAGLPVISTNFSPGNVKEILGNDCDMIIDCNDKKKMAEAMDILLHDKNRILHMSRVNKIRVMQFSEKKMIREWMQTIYGIDKKKGERDLPI